jgi:hypothetical protein
VRLAVGGVLSDRLGLSRQSRCGGIAVARDCPAEAVARSKAGGTPSRMSEFIWI